MKEINIPLRDVGRPAKIENKCEHFRFRLKQVLMFRSFSCCKLSACMTSVKNVNITTQETPVEIK